MANYHKIDTTCVSENRIVFVGNVSLRKYTESDPRYASDPADAELAIDVIASEKYATFIFQDILLVLEILGPTSARFVEHGDRNNFGWDVPDGAGGWIENAVSTTRLRIRWDQGTLLSLRPGDGFSQHVGVAGLSDGDELRLTASASATDVRAVASSCDLGINLHIDEAIRGYLT